LIEVAYTAFHSYLFSDLL